MQDKEKKLYNYAKLAVLSGANVQKGQIVILSSPVTCAEFARQIVKCAYEAGAKEVIVRFNDDTITKYQYQYCDIETLTQIPEYVIMQEKYAVDNNACYISISSPNPGLMKEVDPLKIKKRSIAYGEKLKFSRKHRMENKAQWSIVAYPNEQWAKKVFPNDPNCVEKLLDAILKASRVTEDPIAEWEKHITSLGKHNELLNEYNFDKLCFENSLGTSLEVQLVKNHIWCGGGEYTQNKVYFSPNIPTEETFTMPKNNGVNGKVVATKPLNYQGKLIEDFYLVFKDGAVVDFGAKKEYETLKGLLETDEGSKRLGEVALISHDSPISNMNILFFNTLFDENASCHLALGNAYITNLKDSDKMTEEELKEAGYNTSLVHVDFMFGSKDMQIIGVKEDGSKVVVFKDGNFVF